jgi:dUTP pyrophosphatase
MLASDFSIPVQWLGHGDGLPLPVRGTDLSAGFDVAAAVDESIVLEPFHRALVPTGMILGIPDGYVVEVRPRSGLALKHGVTVLNAPGTIDADYRGELKIMLINLGTEPFVIERGMRIAQLVLGRVIAPTFFASDVPLAPCETRGSNGFGSTGLFAVESTK